MGQGEGQGQGSGREGGGGILWGIIWFLVLIFIAFWLAGFCAGWYILIIPFTVCIEGLKPLTDLLLKGVQFTYFCADAMMNQKTYEEAVS